MPLVSHPPTTVKSLALMFLMTSLKIWRGCWEGWRAFFSSGWSNPAPQPPPTGPKLQPPNHPDGPSTGLASSLCFSWIEDPKLDTAKKYYAERNNHFPVILPMLLLNTAQNSVGCLHCQCTLLNPFSTELKEILTFFQEAKDSLTTISLQKNEIKNKFSSYLIHPLQNESVSVFQIWTEKSANLNWYLGSESAAFE